MNLLLVILFLLHIAIVMFAATGLFNNVKKSVLSIDIISCLSILIILLYNFNSEIFLMGLLFVILSYSAPSPTPGLLDSFYGWSIKNILFRHK